jgi:nucleotide-binding universal stress UspA family protein
MGQLREGSFRVVVGVDFSEPARHAIREGLHFAQVMRAVDLQFVTVLSASPDLHDARVIDTLSDRAAELLVRLEKVVRDEMFAMGEGVRCDLGFHVRVGDPAEQIHQLAVDVDADMIVVGASPHARGVKSWLHHSASAALVRDAHVPVVVARPKDFSGLEKTPRPDPARPSGESHGHLSSYTYVSYADEGRTSHIAGLI